MYNHLWHLKRFFCSDLLLWNPHGCIFIDFWALDDPRHQHHRVMNFWTKKKMTASNQKQSTNTIYVIFSENSHELTESTLQRYFNSRQNNFGYQIKKHVAANQLIINWVNIDLFILLEIKEFVLIPFHPQHGEIQVEQGLACQPPWKTHRWRDQFPEPFPSQFVPWSRNK